MWRVIKRMYESSKSPVFLEGEKSDTFKIENRAKRGPGCSLSPILFSVFIIYNTQMVAVAFGPRASHSKDRAEP